MNDKTFNRILIVVSIVLGIILFGAMRIGFADERYDISADARAKAAASADAAATSSASAIGGDTNTNIDTGGNTSLALVNSLGDVDIAQCLGSTQWGTPIYSRQKLVINWPCMAEFYLRNQKYALAAMALCNTEILDEFASEIDCEVAHDFGPVGPPPDLTGLYDQAAQFDEHYNLAQQQEEEIEYLQEENASIVGRLEALTVMIEQVPEPVQQEELFTDEEFDTVWDILKGAEEDDDD